MSDNLLTPYGDNRKPTPEERRRAIKTRTQNANIQKDMLNALMRKEVTLRNAIGDKTVVTGYDALITKLINMCLDPNARLLEKDRAKIIFRTFELIFGKPKVFIEAQGNLQITDHNELIKLAMSAFSEHHKDRFKSHNGIIDVEVETIEGKVIERRKPPGRKKKTHSG
jgi:Asp-tRNA(Asn)/Glu-tRNA(Gln) amidotransferase B subunit